MNEVIPRIPLANQDNWHDNASQAFARGGRGWVSQQVGQRGTDMYVRTVKVPSSNGTVHEYVRIVEAYREHGKAKQRVVADLGRKDLLLSVLPGLERVLKGTPKIAGAAGDDVECLDACTWGPMLVIRRLFEELDLWKILDGVAGKKKAEVPFADRILALVANRLTRPRSEHGLASWLETDFVCDRQGRRLVPLWKTWRRVQVDFRQLHAWYRALDQLVKNKAAIEVALYHRLRDLFSIRPDLVFYDITSSYFEGAGPKGLARHGYSRDQRRRNVQILVGVVLVAGWPITHHVWAGHRADKTTVQEVIADLQCRFDFQRVVLVGDRGMVSEVNREHLRSAGHGYLVGVRRRRNPQLSDWREKLDPNRWIDGPAGMNAREQTPPPRTRVQELPSGKAGERVLVIDSDERRADEERMRAEAMRRTRAALERLAARVTAGKLKNPAAIGAAAARILARHHGGRYYIWRLDNGRFLFEEHPTALTRERALEGKYILISSEEELTPTDAVARYKELSEVERGFRSMKDVLALRPIFHRTPERVNAHVFIAALALLLERLFEQQLRRAKLPFSASAAFAALETVRVVTFRVADSPPRRGVTVGSPRAREILAALGLSNLRPPQPTATVS